LFGQQRPHATNVAWRLSLPGQVDELKAEILAPCESGGVRSFTSFRLYPCRLHLCPCRLCPSCPSPSCPCPSPSYPSPSCPSLSCLCPSSSSCRLSSSSLVSA